MTFKDWLKNEELNATNLGGTSVSPAPAASKKQLNMAVSAATKMPQTSKWAANVGVSSKFNTQKSAVNLAQNTLKKNPVLARNPAVDATSVANGLLQNLNVPSLGAIGTPAGVKR